MALDLEVESEEKEESAAHERREIPDPQYIAESLPELFEIYEERNDWIARMRRHVNGENKIQAPDDTPYTIMKVHMMSLRAALNERLARFLPIPRYRITPPGWSDPAQAYASNLERGINELMYWIRRWNDDYGRCIRDVLTFEGGAMRWEPNTKAAWPRLMVDVDGEDDITRAVKAEEDEDEEKVTKKKTNAREKYKQSLGNDSLNKLFTHTYVPYEAFYIYPDSGAPTEMIEIEFRPVRKIIDNELFSMEARNKLRELVNENRVSLRAVAPIIRYCNCEVYAYYLIPEVFTPAKDTSLLNQMTNRYKQVPPQGMELLYSYEHDAGMPLYTNYTGSEGGWTAGPNESLIGKLRALEELNSARDNLASQEYTNIRNLMWPKMVTYQNMDRPAQPMADNDPRKINTHGSGNINLYTDEDIKPMVQNLENPLLRGFKADIVEGLSKLTGAPGLFGMHQAGVEGGFQEATLLQQADSVFARTESNIVTASVNDLLVLLSLIRAIGEKVWVRVPAKSPEGRKYYQTLCIDPKQLDQMPVIDAIVKAPPAADLRQQLANYAAAVADISGPGTAAMDRISAREAALNIEQPDEMELRVKLQSTLDQVGPPRIADEIGKKYNLLSVEEQKALANQAQLDPMAMLTADPAAAQQLGPFANGQPPPGEAMMVDPTLMQNPAGTQGMNGGLPLGVGQPAQTEGRIEQISMDGGLI